MTLNSLQEIARRWPIPVKSVSGRLLVLLLLTLASSCSMSRFLTREERVLELDVNKSDLIAHLNRNIVGTDSTPGISAWKTSDAKVQVTGIPFPLPASMAVEAPRNLRILVNHPITGGQEVDLGSNQERFWMWTKEAPEMITCRHEETSLALQHFQMPIQIQPEWLMEVFGVVPINPVEYRLERPNTEGPVVDLIAERTSPTGMRVERVIRVNTFSGHIEQHLLRNADGEIIATARLDKYTQMPNGTTLPTFVKINWPAAKTEMKISLGHPEVNPPSFAVAQTLWEMPNVPGAKVVDIGTMSKLAAGRSGTLVVQEQGDDPAANIRQLRHTELLASPLKPGKVALNPTLKLQAPAPVGSAPFPAEREPTAIFSADLDSQSNSSGLPEWAVEHSTQRPNLPSATMQPSTYSRATWRSSSAPRPPELE